MNITVLTRRFRPRRWSLLVGGSLALCLLCAAAVSAGTNALRVTIRSPSDGRVLNKPVFWDVDVSGGTPSSVEFYIDGRLRWTERERPYRYGGDGGTLSPAVVAPGRHVLKVLARGAGVSAAATLTVSSRAGTLGSGLPARLGFSKGRQYFVDGNSGKDSNRGTLKAPWRTIARAWKSARRGVTINVRAGSYGGQINLTNKTASAANPITVRAYGSERVLLTGPAAEDYTAVFIWRTTGVRFQGFEVANDKGDGIKVDSGTDVEIVGNDIHKNGVQGIIVGSGTGSAAPTYSKNVQIWSNRIHDNGGWWRGGDPYALVGTHGIYYGNTGSNSDGIQHGAVGGVIANNLFYDQPFGFHIQVGSQNDGLIITNNTFDNAYQSDTRAGNAVQLYGEDNQFATKNVLVVNNIIANSANRGVYGSGDSMRSNIVRNNLAYDNPAGDIVPTVGPTVIFALGPGNITGRDPQFVNRAEHDYRPSAGSPAIDRADPYYAPARDAKGRRRVGAPDLGAFEYADRTR